MDLVAAICWYIPIYEDFAARDEEKNDKLQCGPPRAITTHFPSAQTGP